MSLCVTVPPEYSSLSSYRATLGHKVKVSTNFHITNFHITNFHEANHGARPNAEYRSYSAHPVLGSTMAVWASEDLQPGDEVLSYISLLSTYLRIYIYYLSRCSATTATIRGRLSPYPRWRLLWSEQDLIGASSQEFKRGP